MPISGERDGAFVTTNAFVDLTTSREKRYHDDYPSDEDDEHATKRQKTSPATAGHLANTLTQKTRANNTFTRLYAIALGTLPLNEQRVIGGAVAKLRKSRASNKPEPGKVSLYSLLEEDLLSDAELQKKRDERGSKLGWMLQFVMRQPGFEVGEKAELCWLMNLTIIPWGEVDEKLKKVLGVDKDEV